MTVAQDGGGAVGVTFPSSLNSHLAHIKPAELTGNHVREGQEGAAGKCAGGRKAGLGGELPALAMSPHTCLRLWEEKTGQLRGGPFL